MKLSRMALVPAIASALAVLLTPRLAMSQQGLPVLRYDPPATWYRSASIRPEQYSSNEVNAGIQAGRNYEPALDGITEVWVRPADGGAAPVDPETARAASAALVEDERRFVQMDKSRLFMTREHVIFDHTR